MKAMRFTVISFLAVLMLAACQDDGDDMVDEDSHAPEETDETEDTSDEEADIDIEGTIWDGEGDVGIVLSHGAVFDADSWEEQGEELADHGYVAFAVEDTSEDEIVDAANMLEDEYDVDEVVVIGGSAGAVAPIDIIHEESFDFSKAIFLSPGGDASSIDNIPVLMIYSEDEGYDGLEETADFKTMTFPGSTHAQHLFDDEERAEKIMEVILDFLNES